MFTRHENNKFHKDCKEEFLKIYPATSNSIAPEVELWTSKISKQLNSELCCKFVASNLLATEHISNKKYRPVLKAFKKVGAPVGDTHQNLDGFNIFCGVQADKLLQDQKQNFGVMESFGLQADGAHDKSRKPQEATNIRIIDELTGKPCIQTLGFAKLRHQDASTCRSSIFEQLEHHGISKQDAREKMASFTADGAAVNMGQHAGIKALLTKNPGDAGTDPSLDYWGWVWVFMLHGVNHIEELGLKDFKEADDYIKEFDEQLSKVFKVYYYSSTMEAGREELARLTDDDFTSLGGLQQIRWAPSQHRAILKLEKNYKNLHLHCESVAADKHNERNAECEGVLGFLSSLKFVKMMIFLLDLHAVMKSLSLQFQREQLLIVEVEPLLEKTFLHLENLRGGKGTKMLQFADSFEQTGNFKGVELNRARHYTRTKHQSRIEHFVLSEQESISVSLFKSFDFYIDFVKKSFKERFKAVFSEPITWFRIFLYKRWPLKDDPTFTTYGDQEVKSLLKHFAHRFSPERSIKATQECLLFKHAALQKVSEYHCSPQLGSDSQHSYSEPSEDEVDEENIDVATSTQSSFQRHQEAQLCFEMYRDRLILVLEVPNICCLLGIMIVMSPSNAHTERQVKAMNNMKTTTRSRLSQCRTNNQ